MSNLGALRADDFEPHQGTPFRIAGEGGAIEATLIAVVALRGDTVDQAQRPPFSLTFRCPADMAPVQRIYRLEHDTLDPLELFLVPIGPDGEGMRFEAVFS